MLDAMFVGGAVLDPGAGRSGAQPGEWWISKPGGAV